MFCDRFDITLGEFNQEYFNSLPDTDKIVAPALGQEEFYHTVYAEGQPIGVAGIIPSKKLPDTAFTQIVLDPDWRGKGLIGPIYKRLADWHDLRTLYATIDKDNYSSRLAHEKIGFKLLPEEKLIDLRNRGFLDEDKVRFEKEVL